jgi:hypothetical protein
MYSSFLQALNQQAGAKWLWLTTNLAELRIITGIFVVLALIEPAV